MSDGNHDGNKLPPRKPTDFETDGIKQRPAVVIEVQLVIEGREKSLHYGVIQAATHGRHAAADLFLVARLAIGHGAPLAALIGMDKELIWFDLAVAQGSAQGLENEDGLRDGALAHN